jgi:hypothetical protein
VKERRRYRGLVIDEETGFRQRKMVVMRGGVEGYVDQLTRACSGCYEPGECGGRAADYQWDEKAQCRLGSGCKECGYTGKRVDRFWLPFDLRELEPALDAQCS